MSVLAPFKANVKSAACKAVTLACKAVMSVVTLDGTIARASDSVNAANRFSEPLPAGTEVRVEAIRDRWAKISLSNGRSAWVNRFNLGFVDGTLE